MKKHIIFTLAVLLISGFQLAAQPTIIKSGFSVTLPENRISVKAGESKTVDLNVNRSTKFQDNQIELMFSSALPAGVEINFERTTDITKSDKMVITVADNAGATKETLIVNGKSSTMTRGAMFTLEIVNNKNLPAEQQ
jgi:hypothetical protein